MKKQPQEILDRLVSYLRANEEDIAEAIEIDFEVNPKFLDSLLGLIAASLTSLEALYEIAIESGHPHPSEWMRKRALKAINETEGGLGAKRNP